MLTSPSNLAGPMITANWGDWVEVSVTNNLPDEGTSLHWHGLLQAETPWFDGVPSVSQVSPFCSLHIRLIHR
jgi:FtsP/CotA-like multicopper oxidase with cupredoxin domain